MVVKDVRSPAELEAVIASSQRVTVYFWAQWSEPSKYMDSIFSEHSNLFSDTRFIKVEAEEAEGISEKYEISSVPTFLFFKDAKVIDKLEGADPSGLLKKIQSLSEPNMSVNDRIEIMIKRNPVILFMKGDAEVPKCGFSKKVVDALRTIKLKKFETFDILQDEEIRQGLKEYSKWPTYPQLYVSGELVGGCDIVLEMEKSGELLSYMREKLGSGYFEKNGKKNLEALIRKEPVMIFMKGSPESPKCGFSARVVEMLQKSNITFGHFDILQDDAVREGLKTYSNWPTYPQLYANGELMGGCDIITELYNSGELESTIQAAIKK